MSFFKVLFKVLIGLVIVIAVSMYLFIRNFDLNKYKPMIAEMTQKQLGRQLAINGEAKLGLSFVPTLILNDVTLANADWASTEDMVSIGRLEVKLSLLPLLKREVEIDNVTVVAPAVYLEVSADGQKNWDFSKGGKAFNLNHQKVDLLKDQAIASGLIDMKTADAAAEMVKENPQVMALAGFAARHVSVENGVFSMINQQTGQNINAEIKSLEMSAPDMNSAINLEFDVTYNGQEIKGEGEFGGLATLMAETEPYPVKADIQAFGADVALNGTVNGIKSGDISFTATADVSNPLGNMGAPAIELNSAVSGNLKVVNADILKLDVNGNVITGKVSADISESVPYVNAVLNSGSINLQTIARTTQNTAWNMPSLIGEVQASELIPATAVPYDLLKTVNADAVVEIGNLQVNPEIKAENVKLTAALVNGVLNVKPLSLTIGGGDLTANAAVNANSKKVQLTAKGSNIDLTQLYAPLQAQKGGKFGIASGGKLDLDVNLNGVGSTYRQIGDSLDGRIIIIAGETVLQPGKLDMLSGNFITQILHTLKLDTSSKADIDMKCAVVRADVAGGMLNFPKGIALNAKQLNLVSDGKLNLRNDALDFSLRPYSGEVIDANLAQALSSFIKIKGTLNDPKIVLDDAQAIKALVGVAATGGTAYFGSQLLLDTDSSPCYTALKGTGYEKRFPAPSKVNQATQDVYQGAGDVVKGSVDAVKTTGKDLKNSVKDLGNAAKDFLNSLKNK